VFLPFSPRPLQDTEPGIQQTIYRLVDYYKFQTGNNPSLLSRGYGIVVPILRKTGTRGNQFTMYVGESGKQLTPGGSAIVVLKDPVYVGLTVFSSMPAHSVKTWGRQQVLGCLPVSFNYTRR
jgi:hypothetical protein